MPACFVDTGDLAVLLDGSDPRRIVLGRTGSGKTALVKRLADTEERAIVIQPESLALSYISNSTILNFISVLGVKLDIFFRLLWRHVFTVEIIRTQFHIDSDAAKRTFVDKVRSLFSDKKKLRALDYLENWGKTFWEDTDYRIKELTIKLESDLKTSIGQEFLPASLSLEGAKRLSEEQRAEVTQRAQHVVNQVQIQELSEIMDLLDSLLDDPKRRYYIVIDRLDENWIEDRVRYLLIRALIETARDFRKVRHAKVIVALRLDLIDRVFRLTRDAGFQEEKYEALYLELQWSKARLIEVLDARIDYLVKQRYTKARVAHSDLLPKRVGGDTAIDYMLARTMMRPRDIILFFNYCIRQAVDRPSITVDMIRQAEGEYSRARLRSLADEWHADYPNLIRFADILKKRRSAFRLAEIAEEQCAEFCISVVIEGVREKDDLWNTAEAVVDCSMHPVEARDRVIKAFYRVGLVGLKLQPHESTVWSLSGRRSVSVSELNPEVSVSVHPCFWRALGIGEERGQATASA